MIIEPNSLLLDLATNAPGATRVLEDVGIDYYCGGRRTLADGCKRAGVEIETVIPRLVTAAATTSRIEHENWGSRPVVSLLAHLAERHHEAERVELERLHDLFAVAARAAQDDQGALEAIGNTLRAIENVVRLHIADTAASLFPHAMALEAGAGALKLGTPATARLIHRLRTDHEIIRALLEAIRQHTDGYSPPAAASRTARELYAGLAAWERSAHEHAHLENNILVSRILALDPSLERDATPVALSTRRRASVSLSGRSHAHTVYCPAEKRSLDLEWCRDCPFARRVTDTTVECTPRVDPRKDGEQAGRIGERVAVGEAMGGHYVSVGPEVPAGVVADALDEERADAAVIVDNANRLVGTLRRDDAETASTQQTAHDLGQSTPYIDESASLADAIACMVKTHSRFLPVVGSQGRVVGLLADTDALRWVAACSRRMNGSPR